MTRIRRDVWKLPSNDKTLYWYGQAIVDLRARALDNPTSWRYQGAIHDYSIQTDPFHTPKDVLPADHSTFWKQCQHGCAYFLPWHRMYLFYFEQIIATTVVKLGGPPDWSLPYWNYSDKTNANAQKLPLAFRSAEISPGVANPLYVAERAPGVNDGETAGDDLDIDLGCLQDDIFFGEGTGSGGGFGGPDTGNPIHNGEHPGGLEAVPHGSVHVAVGGTGAAAGWMSSFKTAALDPIFWLHHSNIDRLWEVWRNRDATHIIPSSSSWTSQAFSFHDSGGAIVSLDVQDVLDTTAAPLAYEYEDVSDPLAHAAANGAQP